MDNATIAALAGLAGVALTKVFDYALARGQSASQSNVDLQRLFSEQLTGFYKLMAQEQERLKAEIAEVRRELHEMTDEYDVLEVYVTELTVLMRQAGLTVPPRPQRKRRRSEGHDGKQI